MRKTLFFILSCLPTALAAQQSDSIYRTQAIDSVVVTARRPLMVYRRTGNIAVDVEQLKFAPLFAGEKDIFKFLQLLPGVTAGKDGMSGLLVRGGSNDQTQILYDDVPIYNQSHAFGLLSIFSGETVQSAEVSKGYISPAYGSRLSALTQIRTREGDREEHRQSLTVGTLSLAGTVDGPIVRGKGSYLLSARYFFPEAVLAALKNDIRYGFYDVTGKLSYDVHRNHTLSLGLYSGDDHLSNQETDAFNRFGWGNTTASLRLASRWSDRLRSTAVVYYTYLQNRQEAEYRDTDTEARGKTTFKTHELGARFSFEQQVTAGYSLDYGVTLSFQQFYPMRTRAVTDGVTIERGYPARELLSAAVFLNNRFRRGAWSADIGVRGAMYDNGKETSFAAEPRAAIVRFRRRQRHVALGHDELAGSGAVQPLLLFEAHRLLDAVPRRQTATRMAIVVGRAYAAARTPDALGRDLLQTHAQPAAHIRQRRLPAGPRRIRLRHGEGVRCRDDVAVADRAVVAHGFVCLYELAPPFGWSNLSVRV